MFAYTRKTCEFGKNFMYSNNNVSYFVPSYSPVAVDLRNSRNRILAKFLEIMSPNDADLLAEFDPSFLVFIGQFDLD